MGVFRFVALAGALLGVTRPAGAERCGPRNCYGNESCCNDGCGICTPPGVACILPFCPWGRPHYLASERSPTPDIYSRVWGAIGLGDTDAGAEGDTEHVLGVSAIAGFQLYTGERIALRLRASGTAPHSSEPAGSREAHGYALSAGVRGWLPDVRPTMRWSITLDAELADGFDLARSLTPLPRGDEAALSLAAGLAMSGLPHRIGPITWFTRYLHSETAGKEPLRALDAGLGLGSYLTSWSDVRNLGGHVGYRYTHELASSGYRAHELSLGVSFRVSDPLALGVDGDFRWFGAEGSHRAAVLRFDWYWEADD